MSDAEYRHVYRCRNIGARVSCIAGIAVSYCVSHHLNLSPLFSLSPALSFLVANSVYTYTGREREGERERERERESAIYTYMCIYIYREI